MLHRAQHPGVALMTLDNLSCPRISAPCVLCDGVDVDKQRGELLRRDLCHVGGLVVLDLVASGAL